METTLRKFGNSLGVVIPKAIRQGSHLWNEGQKVEIVENEQGLQIKPVSKLHYTLAELLAQCDKNAPVPNSTKEWQDFGSVGKEEW